VKGILRNAVRKTHAKKWVKCERHVYAKSACLNCAGLHVAAASSQCLEIEATMRPDWSSLVSF